MTSVTMDNIRDYVRRYALQRMIVCCKKPLEKVSEALFLQISECVCLFLSEGVKFVYLRGSRMNDDLGIS